jgi:RNA polymerase-binding transcription factor DksA
MKKLFLVFLIINLILPATLAYAAVIENPLIKNTATDRVQITKLKQEIKVLQTQITSNKAKLVKMTKDANNSIDKAKKKLQQLLKKKNNMTQKQLDLLNDAGMRVNIDIKAINDTSENLNKMNLELESAKKGTDYELIKSYMNEIISLQNIKIENLQQAINDMNRISKM